MQTFAIARLLLVFIHVLAFALAFGCVLREDAKLLSSEPLDAQGLISAARLVRFALIILWASGVALIVLDTGAQSGRLAESPKLLAKLTVVGVLTLNGVALHVAAFPTLRGERAVRPSAATCAAVLGAISAASWLAATLLGLARALASAFTYADFMAAYAGMLAAALTFALLVVRPRISAKLRMRPQSSAVRDPRPDVPQLQ